MMLRRPFSLWCVLGSVAIVAQNVMARPVTYTFSGMATGQYISGTKLHPVARFDFSAPVTFTLFGDTDTVQFTQRAENDFTYVQPVLSKVTVTAPGVIPNVTEDVPHPESFQIKAREQGPIAGFPEPPFFHDLQLSCTHNAYQVCDHGNVLRFESFSPKFAPPFGNVLQNNAAITVSGFQTNSPVNIFDSVNGVPAALFLFSMHPGSFTTAIPEPNIYAMLLGGLVVLAFAAKRTRATGVGRLTASLH